MFFWPPTLTSDISTAPWSKSMFSTSYQNPFQIFLEIKGKAFESQCPWAVDGWKKIWQLCWLNTIFCALLKGQNEPKMKIFQLGLFKKFWFLDIYLIKEGWYLEVIWRFCELRFNILATYIVWKVMRDISNFHLRPMIMKIDHFEVPQLQKGGQKWV